MDAHTDAEILEEARELRQQGRGAEINTVALLRLYDAYAAQNNDLLARECDDLASLSLTLPR